MTPQADRRLAPRPSPDTRHLARQAALQMLYQWEVGRMAMTEVRQTFWSGPDEGAAAAPEPIREFSVRLADGVARDVDRLDALVAAAAEHWRLERMNVLDRLILRLATYELVHEADTPAAVIINEALELARTFSGDESVRFVNGVLDAIRRTLERE